MISEAIGWDDRYWGYVFCAICFAITLVSFYPGMLSPDSLTNLSDGRNGTLIDINSPVMSFVWGRLDQIVPGPGLMLWLQNLMFWGGCAVFFRSISSESKGLGFLFIFVGLLPHILSHLTVIWKDVAMGTALFLATALIFLAKKKGSKSAVLAAPLFLFYGYAARLNALPAVFPIAIWWGFVVWHVFGLRPSNLRPALTGFGFFILLSASVYFAIYGLSGGKTAYPLQQVYLYDLAAISVENDKANFPHYVLAYENYSFERVKLRYNERSVNDLIWPGVPKPGDLPVFPFSDDAEQVATLRKIWLGSVLSNPAAYIKHRTRVFLQLIGLSRAVTSPYWAPGFSSSPLEFQPEGNFGTRILTRYFEAFRRPLPQTFFFRGIVWMILCGILLYLAIKRKLRDDWDAVFVAAFSGLLFSLAYYPTTPSTEFRYLFWLSLASAIAVALGGYQLLKESGRNLLGFRLLSEK